MQTTNRAELAEALLLASRALVAVAARSLADADGVTLPQWRALVVLSGGPAPVSALADALDVHPTTATRLCDRLVRKRLVRRVPGADDRRAVEVHLTAAGKRLVHRVTDRRRRDLAAIVARMPAKDADLMVRSLRAFAAAAGEPAEGVDLFGWDAAAE